jgi:hypothetical protein
MPCDSACAPQLPLFVSDPAASPEAIARDEAMPWHRRALWCPRALHAPHICVLDGFARLHVPIRGANPRTLQTGGSTITASKRGIDDTHERPHHAMITPDVWDDVQAGAIDAPEGGELSR